MARKENGGGGEADSTNPNADREEETDTLLDNGQGRATSSDVVDGRRAEVAEEQPLIIESAGSRKQNDVLATPSSSRTDSTAKSNKHTKSVRSSLVPVLVTLDPTDRVSLNTECSVSARTSPCHPQVIPGSAIPPLRSSHIPMLPQSSQEAIQVATVEAGGSPKSSECEEFNICSPKALCGPHPKKVTIVVALILSIWASFILGINIHKKVMTMEDRLSSMTQKMLDLQVKYLDLQVESAEQLSQLHHKVNELSEQRDLRIEKTLHRNPSVRTVDKKSMSTTTTKSTTTTTTSTTGCPTREGKASCIFPFKYKGETHNGCIQKWTDTNPWCPTELDESGTYGGTQSPWDYCDSSCPMSNDDGDDEEDSFWDF